MRSGIARALVIAAAGLWLAGCSATNTGLADLLTPKAAGTNPGGDAYAAIPPAADTQAAIPPPLGVPAADEPGLLGSQPTDDLSNGKKYFHDGNYGMAERYFRRAVELHPSDAEAWLDLAASYDRLRRFDLADRAYAQATHIAGPTVEILNNQGYSYMLRGDSKRARATLLTAQRKDPSNRFVQNNLQLLAASVSKRKAVE